jgi:uncharacterized membrane protein YoaK (UPF0700 family)
VLSTIAGSVDTISYRGLGGLFTAHVTGNIVVLVAHLRVNEPGSVQASKPTQHWARVAIVALIAQRFGDCFNPGSW